jgi:hypothetical protein
VLATVKRQPGDSATRSASQKQYRDNAVLVTMKVLEAADLLTLDLPSASL